MKIKRTKQEEKRADLSVEDQLSIRLQVIRKYAEAAPMSEEQKQATYDLCHGWLPGTNRTKGIPGL